MPFVRSPMLESTNLHYMRIIPMHLIELFMTLQVECATYRNSRASSLAL